MFDVDDIRDWRGMNVVDREGSRIGKLEAIYFDTATDQAAFATVRVGLTNTRLVFVPLAAARVSPKHLRVITDKATAKQAPSIDVDGELQAPAEPGIYSHYGLEYQAGTTGERRLGRR